MGRRSREMALCGVLTALAVTVLLLGGLIPMATFCAPMLAMAVLLPIRSECGMRLTATAYAAVAILAMLLVPDRELSGVFAFFGCYLLVQPGLNRMRSRALRIVLKLAFCNAAIAALYGLLIWLFGLGAVMGEMSGSRWLIAAMVFFANVTFLLLDRILWRLDALWTHRLRRRFFH